MLNTLKVGRWNKMNIKSYNYDDEELIDKIKYFLGSEDYYTEHLQHLVRKKTKTFYLLEINNKLLCFCSLDKNEIKDLHTIYKYRNKGYASKIVKYVIENSKKERIIIGTKNQFVQRIALNNGFSYYLTRGKYDYYLKERER